MYIETQWLSIKQATFNNQHSNAEPTTVISQLLSKSGKALKSTLILYNLI